MCARFAAVAKAAIGWRKVRKMSQYRYVCIFFCEICTRKYYHNSVSRFCWGAKGSRKGRRQGSFEWGLFVLFTIASFFDIPGLKQYSICVVQCCLIFVFFSINSPHPCPKLVNDDFHRDEQHAKLIILNISQLLRIRHVQKCSISTLHPVQDGQYIYI